VISSGDRGSNSCKSARICQKEALQPVEIDVNALVKNGQIIVATLGRQIEISQPWADVWPALSIQAARSALVNLAINARDAMPTAER